MRNHARAYFALRNTAISRELVHFGKGLSRYLNIITALLRKEEERRRAAPLESIASLLEPVILLGTVSVLWYFLNRRNIAPIGGSPVLFYATGFYSVYLFIYLSGKMRRSVGRAEHRFPVEQRLDQILVHMIIRIFDYGILGFLVFGTSYYFFTATANPHDLGKVMLACLFIAMLAFGWGVVNVVLARKFWFWVYIFAVINRSLVLFSGIFFVTEFLPPHMRYVLSFNPILHASTLFKTGFYPNYPTILLDIPYLTYCSVFSVLFGLILERVTRRGEIR